MNLLEIEAREKTWWGPLEKPILDEATSIASELVGIRITSSCHKQDKVELW